MTILVGFISIQVGINYHVHRHLHRTYVLVLCEWRWIVMSEHTIDLLSIPIYQQMARIVYVDRCMVKWAGMLLSEHNEQMKDQEGQSDGAR